MRLLRPFPAVLWLPVYVGSIFAHMGSHRAGLLIVGVASLLLALCGALYLALRRERERGRPRPARFLPVLGGLAAFYVLAAALAAPLVASYAIAALLAGVIPTTAVAIVVATTRAKTTAADDRLRDTSADDHDEPIPGIGLDDATPLGDSPRVHDDLSAHDLPKGYPARRRRHRHWPEQPQA
jgi:small-conductance mechanosensitive channel